MIVYQPSFIPNKIMIVGCGGTGSRLVPLLAQFIKTCAWVMNPEIYLIDDDVVEEKNLLRQNFIASDVGKSKAITLANRYSRAFGVNIVPFQERLTELSLYSGGIVRDEITPRSVMRDIIDQGIVILCVDSPESRREIVAGMLQYRRRGNPSVLLIDAGNENDYGQVTVSTFTHMDYLEEITDKFPKALPGDLVLEGIPTDTGYFQDMRAVSAGSCADLDQTMAINTAMATAIFGLIQNFYYAKPIAYHRMDISLSHGSIPQYMNMNWLQDRKDKPRVIGRGNNSLSSMDITATLRKFQQTVLDPFQEQIRLAEEAGVAAAKMVEEADKKKGKIDKKVAPAKINKSGQVIPSNWTPIPSDEIIPVATASVRDHFDEFNLDDVSLRVV